MERKKEKLGEPLQSTIFQQLPNRSYTRPNFLPFHFQGDVKSNPPELLTQRAGRLLACVAAKSEGDAGGSESLQGLNGAWQRRRFDVQCAGEIDEKCSDRLR